MTMSEGFTGSIAKMETVPKDKCRLWRLRVYRDGKPFRSKRFHGTYRQAQAALVHFQTGIELEPVLGDTTFGQHAATWHERRVRAGDHAVQTLSRDQATINRLLPVFGDVKLKDMTSGMIQDGLLDIKEHGKGGKQLSGTTMNKTFVLMKQVLKSAVLDGLIVRNPMDGLKAPKRDTQEKHAASMEEVRHVLEMLDQRPIDAHTMAVRLMLFAGLRRSEVAGLEWRDYRQGMLYIGRSVAELTGEIKEPKSAAGIRAVPVMPPLEKALGQWMQVQGAQLGYLGIRLTQATPIITNSKGNRMPAQNMWRWWNRNKSELGLDCTLHELRHTYLTMLGNSGASMQALKSIAGWSSIEMARIYVHDDEEANRAAVEQLTRRFEGGTRS